MPGRGDGPGRLTRPGTTPKPASRLQSTGAAKAHAEPGQLTWYRGPPIEDFEAALRADAERTVQRKLAAEVARRARLAARAPSFVPLTRRESAQRTEQLKLARAEQERVRALVARDEAVRAQARRIAQLERELEAAHKREASLKGWRTRRLRAADSKRAEAGFAAKAGTGAYATYEGQAERERLKQAVRRHDPAFQAFCEALASEGIDGTDAVDAWFSPDM